MDSATKSTQPDVPRSRKTVPGVQTTRQLSPSRVKKSSFSSWISPTRLEVNVTEKGTAPASDASPVTSASMAVRPASFSIAWYRPMNSSSVIDWRVASDVSWYMLA